MANPWMKKNPFLSLWLSGINAAAGAARGQAVAEANRQMAQAMTKATQDMWAAWAGGMARPPAPPRRRRRR